MQTQTCWSGGRKRQNEEESGGKRGRGRRSENAMQNLAVAWAPGTISLNWGRVI